MLIVALVLAVIGLAALVTAVVTGNEVIAWVCIAASVIGVVLLIVDALRERQKRDDGDADADDSRSTDYAPTPAPDGSQEHFDADYPEDPPAADAPHAAAADPADETAESSSESGRSDR
jgi:hypothetical protein